MRVSLEALLYSSNCVLTLTYDNEHLPEGGLLCKRDLQLFIKRLRKHVGALRYFACGEYGSLKGRPHFHVIVFGYCPDDLVFLKRDRKGTILFNSSFISRLWSKGFISVCNEVTPYTARYCAKYFQKRNGGAFKPFLLMSRKPGIGLPGYKEAWAYTDKLYIGGKTIRLPRYFIDKTEDASAVADLKQRRLSRLSPFHYPDHDEYFCFDRDRYLSYCAQRRIDFFDKFPFLGMKCSYPLFHNLSTMNF